MAALQSWSSAGLLGMVRALIRDDDEPYLGRRWHGDLPDEWDDSLVARDRPRAGGLGAVGGQDDPGGVGAGARGCPGWSCCCGTGRWTCRGPGWSRRSSRTCPTSTAAGAEALLLPELTAPPRKTWTQVERIATAIAAAVDPDLAERRRKAAEKRLARVRMFRERSGAAGPVGAGPAGGPDAGGVREPWRPGRGSTRSPGVFPEEGIVGSGRRPTWTSSTARRRRPHRLRQPQHRGRPRRQTPTPPLTLTPTTRTVWSTTTAWPAATPIPGRAAPARAGRTARAASATAAARPPTTAISPTTASRVTAAVGGGRPPQAAARAAVPGNGGAKGGGSDKPGGDAPHAAAIARVMAIARAAATGRTTALNRATATLMTLPAIPLGTAPAPSRPPFLRPPGGPPPTLTDLVLLLATLLGHAERPGEGHGLGTIDPALVRALAATAALSPHTTICLTVTDPTASPSATAAPRPAAAPPRPPAGPAPPLVALPARINLTITAARLYPRDCARNHREPGPPRQRELPAGRSPGAARARPATPTGAAPGR